MTSIDDRLDAGAADLRAIAEERAGRMEPPMPATGRTHRALAIALSAVLIAGGIVGVRAATRSAPEGDVPPDAEAVRPVELEPIPGRSGWWRIDDADTELWLPDAGWHATTQSITPEKSLYWDEFVVDRVVTVSTFPLDDLTPTAPEICEPMPFAALTELGPTDALLTVVERTPQQGLPERPRNDGIFAGDPERFYPGQGEFTKGFCERELEAATGTPVGGTWSTTTDLYLRYYPFSDGDRSFLVTVAVGPEASDRRRIELWQMFDRLDFHPS